MLALPSQAKNRGTIFLDIGRNAWRNAWCSPFHLQGRDKWCCIWSVWSRRAENLRRKQRHWAACCGNSMPCFKLTMLTPVCLEGLVWCQKLNLDVTGRRDFCFWNVKREKRQFQAGQGGSSPDRPRLVRLSAMAKGGGFRMDFLKISISGGFRFFPRLFLLVKLLRCSCFSVQSGSMCSGGSFGLLGWLHHVCWNICCLHRPLKHVAYGGCDSIRIPVTCRPVASVPRLLAAVCAVLASSVSQQHALRYHALSFCSWKPSMRATSDSESWAVSANQASMFHKRRTYAQCALRLAVVQQCRHPMKLFCSLVMACRICLW